MNPSSTTSPCANNGLSRQRTIPAVPARPFAPPDGFSKTPGFSSKSTDVSKAFSNLKGKQIWHITAPAGVSLASLETLALDAVATGQPVLSHNGVKYRVREDQLGAEKTKTLLLPDQNGRVYRRERLPVVQTFHLEQVVDLPNNVTLSQKETQNSIKKLARPLPSKPKNLRMRYTPFGSTGVPEPAEESEPEEPTFKEPPSLHEPKKRKHPDIEKGKAQPNASGESTAKTESPRKKAKKSHSHPSANGAAKPEDQEDERGRAKTDQSQSTPHKSSKKRRDETSQERRARREEKKGKKREKES